MMFLVSRNDKKKRAVFGMNIWKKVDISFSSHLIDNGANI